MFIQLDDLKKCLPSILINYGHTNYRIFLPDDSLTGYLCKSQGHIASQYTKQNDSLSIMSKENNDQLISNVTLKLDAIPNTDNTPIVAYPSSDISTRSIKYLF